MCDYCLAIGPLAPPLCRCDWIAYPSRLFLSGLGFGRAAFACLCCLSGSGVDRRMSARPSEHGRADSVTDSARRAKDVLDQGRVEYLRAHGFDASLVTYVDSAISPENVLIVAVS